MAFSPTGPFWFADNGSGLSDILDGRGQPFSLVVTVPSGERPRSAATGTVFNGGSGFVVTENGVSAPSRFLFASEDGTVSGWTAMVDPTRALLAVDNSSSGAKYTGLTLATGAAGDSFLYAADFGKGMIDVFDSNFRPIGFPGAFHDPNLPDDFVPFNVQNINNMLFVTYAPRDEDSTDNVAGAPGGFVDVYDTGGSLVRRFASAPALNSPWGLALAPSDFGPFGGALLIGNNGDGRITAFDPSNGAFLGQVADNSGVPIVIPGLWALSFGNGHVGGDAITLFFTAGLQDEVHGLFGALQSSQRRSGDTGGAGVFDRHAPGEPGDYPLPPRGGPAFRLLSDEGLMPTANLLPSRESSLVLLPTLSTLLQENTVIAASRQGNPLADVSVHRSVAISVPGSRSTPSSPADRSSPPEQGASTDAALTTFLDLRVSQTNPALQRLHVRLLAVGPRSAPPADRAAEAEDVLLLLDHADEVVPRFVSESPPASANESAVSDRVETQKHLGWTNLMKVLFLFCLPLVCGFWPTCGRDSYRYRTASEKQDW